MLVHSPYLTIIATRRTRILRAFGCRRHVVFLWCYICFVLFRFRLFSFTEVATVRTIALRYACAPTSTRSYLTIVCMIFSFFFILLFSFLWSRLFRVFLYHNNRFLVVCRLRRTCSPSGWCFFYLVTTGWIFYIRLCENSINHSSTNHTPKSTKSII